MSIEFSLKSVIENFETIGRQVNPPPEGTLTAKVSETFTTSVGKDTAMDVDEAKITHKYSLENSDTVTTLNKIAVSLIKEHEKIHSETLLESLTCGHQLLLALNERSKVYEMVDPDQEELKENLTKLSDLLVSKLNASPGNLNPLFEVMLRSPPTLAALLSNEKVAPHVDRFVKDRWEKVSDCMKGLGESNIPEWGDRTVSEATIQELNKLEEHVHTQCDTWKKQRDPLVVLLKYASTNQGGASYDNLERLIQSIVKDVTTLSTNTVPEKSAIEAVKKDYAEAVEAVRGWSKSQAGASTLYVRLCENPLLMDALLAIPDLKIVVVDVVKTRWDNISRFLQKWSPGETVPELGNREISITLLQELQKNERKAFEVSAKLQQRIQSLQSTFVSALNAGWKKPENLGEIYHNLSTACNDLQNPAALSKESFDKLNALLNAGQKGLDDSAKSIETETKTMLERARTNYSLIPTNQKLTGDLKDLRAHLENSEKQIEKNSFISLKERILICLEKLSDGNPPSQDLIDATRKVLSDGFFELFSVNSLSTMGETRIQWRIPADAAPPIESYSSEADRKLVALFLQDPERKKTEQAFQSPTPPSTDVLIKQVDTLNATRRDSFIAKKNKLLEVTQWLVSIQALSQSDKEIVEKILQQIEGMKPPYSQDVFDQTAKMLDYVSEQLLPCLNSVYNDMILKHKAILHAKQQFGWKATPDEQKTLDEIGYLCAKEWRLPEVFDDLVKTGPACSRIYQKAFEHKSLLEQAQQKVAEFSTQCQVFCSATGVQGTMSTLILPGIIQNIPKVFSLLEKTATENRDIEALQIDEKPKFTRPLPIATNVLSPPPAARVGAGAGEPPPPAAPPPPPPTQVFRRTPPPNRGEKTLIASPTTSASISPPPPSSVPPHTAIISQKPVPLTVLKEPEPLPTPLPVAEQIYATTNTSLDQLRKTLDQMNSELTTIAATAVHLPQTAVESEQKSFNDASSKFSVAINSAQDFNNLLSAVAEFSTVISTVKVQIEKAKEKFRVELETKQKDLSTLYQKKLDEISTSIMKTSLDKEQTLASMIDLKNDIDNVFFESNTLIETEQRLKELNKKFETTSANLMSTINEQSKKDEAAIVPLRDETKKLIGESLTLVNERSKSPGYAPMFDPFVRELGEIDEAYQKALSLPLVNQETEIKKAKKDTEFVLENVRKAEQQATSNLEEKNKKQLEIFNTNFFALQKSINERCKKRGTPPEELLSLQKELYQFFNSVNQKASLITDLATDPVKQKKFLDEAFKELDTFEKSIPLAIENDKKLEAQEEEEKKSKEEAAKAAESLARKRQPPTPPSVPLPPQKKVQTEAPVPVPPQLQPSKAPEPILAAALAKKAIYIQELINENKETWLQTLKATRKTVKTVFRGTVIKVRFRDGMPEMIVKNPHGEGAYNNIYLVISSAEKIFGQFNKIEVYRKPKEKGEQSQATIEKEIRVSAECRDGKSENETHVSDVKLVQSIKPPAAPKGEILERSLFDCSETDQLALLSQEEKLRICFCAADGLQRMHNRGWCHLDFSSKNLLVKKNNDNQTIAVVVDFGNAVRKFSPYNTGSLAYMPPEAFEPIKNASPKVDPWSLALVIIELVKGKSANAFLSLAKDEFLKESAAWNKAYQDTIQRLDKNDPLDCALLKCLDPNHATRGDENDILEALKTKEQTQTTTTAH